MTDTRLTQVNILSLQLLRLPILQEDFVIALFKIFFKNLIIPYFPFLSTPGHYMSKQGNTRELYC